MPAAAASRRKTAVSEGWQHCRDTTASPDGALRRTTSPTALGAALDAVLIAAFTGRLGELIAEARRLRERERLTYDALNSMKEGGDS